MTRRRVVFKGRKWQNVAMPKDLLERLAKRKIHPRQAYHEVIRRLLDD